MPHDDASPQTFRSDTMGINYTLPEGVKADPVLAASLTKTLTEKVGNTPSGAPCVSVPFLGVDSEDFRIVYLFRRDGGCPTYSGVGDPGAMAVASLAGSLGGFGTPVISEPVRYTIGSHAAFAARGKAFYPKLKGIVYAAMTCTPSGKDLACWEFLAATPEELSHMAQLPVAFAGSDAAPLLPSATLGETTLPKQTFADSAVHFSLEYDGELARIDTASSAALETLKAKSEVNEKAMIECTSIKMSAQNQDSSGPVTFLIFEMDLACSKMDMEVKDFPEFAVGVAKGVGRTTRNELSKGTPYKLAGHDAILVDGYMYSANGKATALGLACALIEKNIVCFEASAPTQEKVRDLLSMQITFAGQHPEPIAPTTRFTRQVNPLTTK